MMGGIISSLMATDILRDKAFRILFESSLDAVIVMREDGTVADVNDNAIQTFGWSREDFMGQDVARVIIPERYRARHYAGMRRWRETGVADIEGKRVLVSALRKSGEEFPVELSICAIESGRETLFVGHVRDLMAPFK